MTATVATRHCSHIVWLSAALALCAGCAEEAAKEVQLKRPDEVLTDAEWQQFTRVVEGLGPTGLTDLPGVFAPKPDWPATRTLPVSELATGEQRTLEEQSSPQVFAARFVQRPGLARLLRRENLSAEQFAGITLAVAAALARAHIPPDEPLDELLRRGQTVIDVLKHDGRLYSSMEIESRYSVLDHALWLHRIDRIERLRRVPDENVARVKSHADWLAKVLPAGYRDNPLAELSDRLDEQGLPFVELPESGQDAHIDWDPATALK